MRWQEYELCADLIYDLCAWIPHDKLGQFKARVKNCVDCLIRESESIRRKLSWSLVKDCGVKMWYSSGEKYRIEQSGADYRLDVKTDAGWQPTGGYKTLKAAKDGAQARELGA